MEPSELLQRATEVLDRLAIPYLVTGSMATIIYGEPRMTNDVDIVVDLKPNHIEAFCAAFPEPEYYCPRDFVAEAIRRRFQFNVIHPASGLKLDVMLPSGSPFDRSRFSRAVRLKDGPGVDAWFATAEDVILKKLEYYKEGGSEKHIRDILGVLKRRGERIDRAYIGEWAERLHVKAEWELIVERSAASNGAS
jgi:hypothetical protein